MPTGQHLLDQLDVPDGASVFGIAYSIITMSGVMKGAGISPGALVKTAGKLLEDGHATTFFIHGDEITLTGMGYRGWVFNDGPLASEPWARDTANANTDVYYTVCTPAEAARYAQIRAELEGQRATTYHEFRPNLPGGTRYENCISSSHMIVHRMGYGSAIATKGVWIPSVSNWATWTATKFSAWKHKRFAHTNTHMP